MANLTTFAALPRVRPMDDRRTPDAAGFRARLRQALAVRNLNGAQLAELAGIAKTSWSEWTRDVSPKVPTADSLAVVARALEVSLDWLWWGEDHVGLVDESLIDALRSVQAIVAADARGRRMALAKLLSDRIHPVGAILLFTKISHRLRPITSRDREDLEKETDAIFRDCCPDLARLWDELLNEWIPKVLKARGEKGS